jgi:hypothetical protein
MSASWTSTVMTATAVSDCKPGDLFSMTDEDVDGTPVFTEGKVKPNGDGYLRRLLTVGTGIRPGYDEGEQIILAQPMVGPAGYRTTKFYFGPAGAEVLTNYKAVNHWLPGFWKNQYTARGVYNEATGRCGRMYNLFQGTETIEHAMTTAFESADYPPWQVVQVNTPVKTNNAGSSPSKSMTKRIYMPEDESTDYDDEDVEETAVVNAAPRIQRPRRAALKDTRNGASLRARRRPRVETPQSSARNDSSSIDDSREVKTETDDVIELVKTQPKLKILPMYESDILQEGNAQPITGSSAPANTPLPPSTRTAATPVLNPAPAIVPPTTRPVTDPSTMPTKPTIMPSSSTTITSVTTMTSTEAYDIFFAAQTGSHHPSKVQQAITILTGQTPPLQLRQRAVFACVRGKLDNLYLWPEYQKWEEENSVDML